jgi:N-acetylmuramoyl-L-alanine amidase
MKPLAGYRIAIDPGHIANDTIIGKLEEKFISMNVPAGTDSMHVAFAEGQLTWQTAVLLAARLREAGAEVIFTRNGPGMTAFGKTFEQWKQDDYPRTLDSLLKEDPGNQNLKDIRSGKLKGDRAVFRFVFRDAELRKRAEIINAFQPHLTVAIHYNVDESNSPWSRPTNKNFCMLFVPGAFQEGELSDSEKRFDFLRLLLLNDIGQSVAVSTSVGAQFTARLNVKAANASDAGYLRTSCKKTGVQGIYARNLSMTRLVHGPIVFGETLYQDNVNEAAALSNMSITDRISGQQTSKRVMQVADAYFEGILQWSYAQ